jgi:hypothetical protein
VPAVIVAVAVPVWTIGIGFVAETGTQEVTATPFTEVVIAKHSEAEV